MSSTPTQPESTREHMAVRCMACGFIAGESVDPFGDWRRYGCYGEGREGAEHGPTETAPVVLEHQLEEARQELRKLTSKLESGYSFCHPENDCEGMKAAMREAGRLEEVRAELEKLIRKARETAAGYPAGSFGRSQHATRASNLDAVLALLTTPGDGERPGETCERCDGEGEIHVPNPAYCDCIMTAHCYGKGGKEGRACRLRRSGSGGEGSPAVAGAKTIKTRCPDCNGTGKKQPAPGASEWPEVWVRFPVLVGLPPEVSRTPFDDAWDERAEGRRYVPAPEGGSDER